MTNIEMFLKLVKDNPELPIVPMVDYEVFTGDEYTWWMGNWGSCKVTEYYIGKESIHFKDEEDEEDVLADIAGCKHYCTPEGKDIYDISDEEWDKLYKSIPWTKAIVVYITT